MGAPELFDRNVATGAPVGTLGGTTNTIPRWTGPTTLGDSVLVQVGTGIGLGTSTLYTGTKFQVSGSGGVAAITSEDTNGGGNFLRWLADTTNQPLINWTTGSALRFATSTSAFGTFAEWMRITSTGYVGIGTASPNKKLQVVDGASGEVRFTTTANVPANTFTQRFSSNAGGGTYEGGGAYVQAIQGSGIDSWSLAFGTANASATATERARIDSAGRLLVGTTGTPSSNSVRVVVSNVGGGGQQWHNQGAGGCAVVPSANTGQWYVYPGGNVGSEGYLASVKMTETGLDVTTASATPGIKLPATPGNADAQTLDAYQEMGSGTYVASTATLTCGTSGTITLKTTSDQNKLYVTRIGRTVHVSGFLVVDSVSSPTGRLTITTSPALPAVQNGAGANIVFTGPTGLVAGDLIQPTISASTIFCDVYNAGVQSQTGAAKMQANTSLWVSFSYHAA